MKVVISAGGKGSRIQTLTKDIPKAMLKLAGKPILEYQIECLKKQNLKEIIILLGHLGSVIEEYFKDGKNFGVNISYSYEPIPLGNSGGLLNIKDNLTDDFLFIFGDIIFDIDFDKVISFHKEKKASATLIAHPNDHPYDSTIIEINEAGLVTDINFQDNRKKYYKNLVNSGIHILSPYAISSFKNDTAVNADRDIFLPLVKEKRLYAYNTTEYIKDAGTPERLKEIENDIIKNKVQDRKLSRKQKAIFIDRDGVINKDMGMNLTLENFTLQENTADAIKLINKNNYLAIIITNQPIIAKGMMTFEELDNIHKKLETLLGEKGAYIDKIYFCPHHPESGFKGEIKELKTDCDCRKPQPGMLIQAAKAFNIDLESSWIVGDKETDLSAGKNAGCKTIYISDKYSKLANYNAKDLKKAVSLILCNTSC